MTPTLSDRLSTWLLLVMVVLVGITPSSGLAICFGEGWHIHPGAEELDRLGAEPDCFRSLGYPSAGEYSDGLPVECDHGGHQSCSDLMLEALWMQRTACDASPKLPDTLWRVDSPLLPLDFALAEAPASLRKCKQGDGIPGPSSRWLGVLRSNVLIL